MIIVLFVIYGVALIFFYFKQEKFFFNPKLLPNSYVYDFKESFEEININVDDETTLNTVLFSTSNPKGVVLYLHGNAGALSDWGKRAHLFLENKYDILFVDYRGYGKSNGAYTNEKEIFSDMQIVYNELKKRYSENKIIILGYSLGSGLAAQLASTNEPKLLILNAPYFSWKTLIAEEIAPPVLKSFINYDIKTYEYLSEVICPIQIFHGTRDYLINIDSNSLKLKKLYPDKITFNKVVDASHNNIHITKHYYDALKKML